MKNYWRELFRLGLLLLAIPGYLWTCFARSDWWREISPHWPKLAAILALFLLASHWDYQDTQRIQAQRNWARVANR